MQDVLPSDVSDAIARERAADRGLAWCFAAIGLLVVTAASHGVDIVSDISYEHPTGALVAGGAAVLGAAVWLSLIPRWERARKSRLLNAALESAEFEFDSGSDGVAATVRSLDRNRSWECLFSTPPGRADAELTRCMNSTVVGEIFADHATGEPLCARVAGMTFLILRAKVRVDSEIGER